MFINTCSAAEADVPALRRVGQREQKTGGPAESLEQR